MGPQHDHNLLHPSREAALPGEAERLLAAQVESFRNRNRNRRAPKMLRNYRGQPRIHMDSQTPVLIRDIRVGLENSKASGGKTCTAI